MSKNFGVIGFPIGHTMSPFIHKELFKMRGVDADYDKYQIEPEKLNTAFNNSLKLLNGINVTIPHKVEIIKLLDALDPIAAEYGAVNTVASKDGKYIGFNTDAYGFLKGLEFSGLKLSGKVAVCGFGGAARTIITESLKAGCEVTVITIESLMEKAKTVVAELIEKSGKPIKLIKDTGIAEQYDLLINATPVGMYPNVENSPIAESALSHFAAVYDIVYNPTKTKLLKMATKKGIPSGGGMSMLVCQAELAHYHWFGSEFSKAETANLIKAAEEELERTFLK